MSIVKIENGEIVASMPLNHPIDDTWRFVYDEMPNYNSEFEKFMGYEFSYDVETDTVTSVPIIVDLAVEEAKANKLAELADLRWRKQNSSMDFNGIQILTDQSTLLNILGCRVAVNADPNLTFQWKTPAGFVTLNAAYIVAISDGIRGFIQACFDNEKDHIDAINALNTTQDVEDYDISTGWPS